MGSPTPPPPQTSLQVVSRRGRSALVMWVRICIELNLRVPNPQMSRTNLPCPALGDSAPQGRRSAGHRQSNAPRRDAPGGVRCVPVQRRGTCLSPGVESRARLGPEWRQTRPPCEASPHFPSPQFPWVCLPVTAKWSLPGRSSLPPSARSTGGRMAGGDYPCHATEMTIKWGQSNQHRLPHCTVNPSF